MKDLLTWAAGIAVGWNLQTGRWLLAVAILVCVCIAAYVVSAMATLRRNRRQPPVIYMKGLGRR